MAPSVADLKKASDAAASALAKAEADEAALEKARSSPRTPEVVLTDLLVLFAMRLGNRKDLQLLIAEYKAATKQEEPPAPE